MQKCAPWIQYIFTKPIDHHILAIVSTSRNQIERIGKRVAELRAQLNEANRAYYLEANPTMADSEYDALMRELIDLEEAHPELQTPDSPTQRVGGEPVEAFHTVPHRKPMLSIDNTYDINDLREWVERVKRLLVVDNDNSISNSEGDSLFNNSPESDSSTLEFHADPKIDGVAVSLRYEKGLPAFALTRGDGVRGDDVINNIKRIRSVPLRLQSDDDLPLPEVIEVRGEIYMLNSVFARINEERADTGESLFANPRNMTAGTLKSLDPRVTARRQLCFTAHGKGEVVWGDEFLKHHDEPQTHSQFLSILKLFSIPIPHHTIVSTSFDDITNFIEQFDTQRHELDFNTDGVVVRINDFALQEKVGYTSKSPRWCIAYKYPAEQATTVLLDINWLVGKGGTITPRATLEPVKLAGTTIRHATLHNIDELHRKDIRIGDTVFIEKAGEIIPQVVKPVLAKRKKKSHPVSPPESCPVCNAPIEKEGPKLYCTNPECPGQISEKLKWFVGRKQMDIDSLGEKTIDIIRATQGTENKIPLNHFADIFQLDKYRDTLINMKGFKEKKVDNMLSSIEKAKSLGLRRVLAGLGIRHIGATAAKTLAQRFPDAEALMNASTEELESLSDFGPIVARSLHDFLHSTAGKETFRRLAEAGVDLTSREYQSEPADFDSPLAGKTIVITGTLEHYKRDDLKELLEKYGAKVTSAVSPKTDILIAGVKPGSKFTKAKKLNIEIWDENAITEILSHFT